MRVKCKLCGEKGYWDLNDSPTKYGVSRFLVILIKKKGLFRKKKKSFIESDMEFICRECLSEILIKLHLEQLKIKKLYEPEIKNQVQKVKSE